jgi:hypothetical protein
MVVPMFAVKNKAIIPSAICENGALKIICCWDGRMPREVISIDLT